MGAAADRSVFHCRGLVAVSVVEATLGCAYLRRAPLRPSSHTVAKGDQGGVAKQMHLVCREFGTAHSGHA